MSNLKAQLTAALAGTTSQKPIDTATLTQGHQRRLVEAELMRMYSRREAGCCKITKGGQDSVVWWLIGVLPPTPSSMLNSAIRKKRAAVEVEI